MESKASYMKVEDVEGMPDEKGGSRIGSAKKVGTVRGFLIVLAALSLTILIGLAVVVVINDINEQPRHNGYYGHSPKQVPQRGCRFHMMSLDWLRADCQDVQSTEKFRSFGSGDWYTDADRGEPCDMDESLIQEGEVLEQKNIWR